jgi:DNA polymerase-3 subunit delta'
VEEIRQMRDDAAVKPYASARKIYIVEDAELMNTQAQNALLKTLEEPPAYVVIILIADGTSRFLPTVMSRCITLHMKQVPEETMIRFLMKERGISEEKARLCASFAVGNLGRAVKIADDPDFDNQRKDAEQILAGITEMSFTDIVNIANDIFPKKKAGADENAAAGDEGKKKGEHSPFAAGLYPALVPGRLPAQGRRQHGRPDPVGLRGKDRESSGRNFL